MRLPFLLLVSTVITLFASSSLLIGIVTKDSVLLSSNNVFSKNGVAMRGDFDWIKQLGDDCLVGFSGDSSDCDYLISQLESSSRDHQMTFGRSLPCRSVAYLCRKIIAKHLRSGQLKVNILVAGWNYDSDLPSLYWLDSIGAIQEVPYAAHGDGFSFVLGLLDLSNRMDREILTERADTHETKLVEEHDQNISQQGAPTKSKDATKTSAILTNGEQKQLQVVRPTRKGSLTLMSVTEGVATIRACMVAARKRTLGSLGSYRIKGVTNKGCIDLGTV